MSTKERPKLTPAIEKKITQDWAREFPGMGIYKKRWLMRRVGPLLIGICLDRDSHGDLYKPIFHVFFLGCKWDGKNPALTLYTELRTVRTNAPDDVEVRWHEKKYLDAVERMKRQSLLPLEGPVALDQVLQAYREHHRRMPMGYASLTADVILMSDVIMLLAWCGRREEAEQALEEVLATVVEKPGEFITVAGPPGKPPKKHPKPSPYSHPYGSRQAFETAMREAIEHPETLREQVKRQISRLGVEQLPVSELLCE